MGDRKYRYDMQPPILSLVITGFGAHRRTCGLEKSRFIRVIKLLRLIHGQLAPVC